MSQPALNSGPEQNTAHSIEPPLAVALSEFGIFFDSALGGNTLSIEKHRLQQELSHLVGYNGIQLSAVRGQTLLDQQSMGHAVTLGYALEDDRNDDVLADFQQLPVASECIDVLLLHHVLELAAEPTQLLREADRVLKPGGHMVIFSYNLISLWPLYIRFWQWKNRARWSRLPALRQGRVHDWLMALNYDIVGSDKLGGRVPVNHPAWVNKTRRMGERLDQFGLPLSMICLTVACKRSQPVNPLLSADWKRLFQGKPQTVSSRRGASSKTTREPLSYSGQALRESKTSQAARRCSQ